MRGLAKPLSHPLVNTRRQAGKLRRNQHLDLGRRHGMRSRWTPKLSHEFAGLPADQEIKPGAIPDDDRRVPGRHDGRPSEVNRCHRHRLGVACNRISEPEIAPIESTDAPFSGTRYSGVRA